MYKKLIYLGLLALTLLGSYVSWRSKAPLWTGQDLEHTYTPSSPFHILFVGDTGSGGEPQKAVAEAMEKICQDASPTAVFMLGDNFYPKGVQSPQDPMWQSHFQTIYQKPCLSQLPFFAILGNHDYMGKAEAQIAYVSPSGPQWKMPFRHYSIDFAKRLRVIALDSTIMDLCGSAKHCSLDFLQKQLKGPQRETIVLAHHPIRSLSAKYTGESVPGRILRQFLCGHPLLFMSGHSHHLEHRLDPSCEIEHVINGAGGAGLYDIRPMEKDVLFAKSTHGFVSMKLEDDQSILQFYKATGELLYEYTRPLPPQKN